MLVSHGEPEKFQRNTPVARPCTAPLQPDLPRDSTHCFARQKLLTDIGSSGKAYSVHLIRNKALFVPLENFSYPSQELVLLFQRQSTGENLTRFLEETSSVRKQDKSTANRGNIGILLVRLERKSKAAQGHTPSCGAQYRTVLSSQNCHGRMYLGSHLGLPTCDPTWPHPSFCRDNRLSRPNAGVCRDTKETDAAFQHLQTQLSDCPPVLPLSTPKPPQQ